MVKGVVLTLELPKWRFCDLMDLLCGKTSPIAPDTKPLEGSICYSADNPMSQDSVCSAMESSWNCPRSSVGTQLCAPAPISAFAVSDE